MGSMVSTKNCWSHKRILYLPAFVTGMTVSFVNKMLISVLKTFNYSSTSLNPTALTIPNYTKLSYKPVSPTIKLLKVNIHAPVPYFCEDDRGDGSTRFTEHKGCL